MFKSLSKTPALDVLTLDVLCWDETVLNLIETVLNLRKTVLNRMRG
jgi:hypothetical protein